MNDTPSKKILILAQSENTRESLKLILGDFYNLILTDTAEQCQECLQHGKDITCLLVDQDALDKIAAKAPEGLKVIAINDGKSQSPAHTDACITKPFKADGILDVIKKNS